MVLNSSKQLFASEEA